LVDYLETGNYFGTDISSSLLDAGYHIELAQLGLKKKLPRNQLVTEEDFSLDTFDEKFDFAIASSLFTHLPQSKLILCLKHLAPKIKFGGKFFATFFICAPDQQWSKPITHPPCDVITFPSQDPYHYRLSDLESCIEPLPWKLAVIQNWEHSRGQQMVAFQRMADNTDRHNI